MKIKMRELRIIIKTPIWTGDIDQKSNLPQSTGIVGSVRWWAEVILRGIKKYACDPTDSDGRCPKKKRNRNYYCSACLIFGATGIRRAFRLSIYGGEKFFLGNVINIKPSGRNRGWYLEGGVIGEIDLSIIFLDRDSEESLVLIPLVIASKWGGLGAKLQQGYGVVEIENCPEIDFNRFEKALEKITSYERLSKLKINLRHEGNKGFPDIREMFFTKLQFKAENEWWRNVDGVKQALKPKDKRDDIIKDLQGKNEKNLTYWFQTNSVLITPAIKNWLRYKNGTELWKTTHQNQNERIENWLFGTTKRICLHCFEEVRKDRDNPQKFWCLNCRRSLEKKETIERIASKINISFAYTVNENLWEFRIWGWIPKRGLPTGFNRDSFLDTLKQALDGSGPLAVPWNELLGDQTRNHRLKTWREFDSPRDTVRPNESNISNYLQSLLKDEGG